MRIRTIKPEFYKDEDLAELPPLTRILFSGLWGLADGEGRLEYRPKFIKAEVLPYDDCDVSGMLESLDATGFIVIYEIEGRSYIEIPNFRKHQRISGREVQEKSTIPPPQNVKKRDRKRCGSNAEAIRKQSGSNAEVGIAQEGKGKEGKGTEGEGREGRGVGGEGGDLANPGRNGHFRNGALEPVEAKPVKPKPPHVEFVESFKTLYERQTGAPFNFGKHHFVLAEKLLRTHGAEALGTKVKTLAVLCLKRSAWFVNGGWSDFTIETLSNHWNRIIPEAHRDENAEEMRRQEVLREQADRLLRGG